MAKPNVYALFIVDQSNYDGAKEFINIIKGTVKSNPDLAYDVYTYTDKGIKPRVKNNVGNMNIGRLKNGGNNTFKEVANVVDEIGVEIDVLDDDEKPNKVIVFIMSDSADVEASEEDVNNLVSVLATQKYQYGWKEFITGEERFEYARKLGLENSQIVKPEVSILSRLIDDLGVYGDCGAFDSDM